MSVSIKVSYGELLDKISILEIKIARIEAPAKRANILTELSLLQQTWLHLPIDRDGEAITSLRSTLKSINECLWDIEDKIRDFERRKEFNEEFIRLARDVYITNDKRAAIKREIDSLLGSTFTEEKAYKPY